MEHIDDVVRQIEKRVPGVRVRVERTSHPRGPVWVDVTNGKFGASIEWRQGMGFGLTSLPSESVGESADEVYEDVAELVNRVGELLASGERTSPLHASSTSSTLLEKLLDRPWAKLIDPGIDAKA